MNPASLRAIVVAIIGKANCSPRGRRIVWRRQFVSESSVSEALAMRNGCGWAISGGVLALLGRCTCSKGCATYRLRDSLARVTELLEW